METYLHINLKHTQEFLREYYPAMYSVAKSSTSTMDKKLWSGPLKFSNTYDGWENLVNHLKENSELLVKRLPEGQVKRIVEFMAEFYDYQTILNATHIYIENIKIKKTFNMLSSEALHAINNLPFSIVHTEGKDVKTAIIYYNTPEYLYSLIFCQDVGENPSTWLAIEYWDTFTKKISNLGVYNLTSSLNSSKDFKMTIPNYDKIHGECIRNILNSVPKIVEDFNNPEIVIGSASVDNNEKYASTVRTPKERQIISSDDPEIVIRMKRNTKYYRECKAKGLVTESIHHSTHARPVEHKAYYRERVLKDGTVRPAFWITKNAGVPCTAKHRSITVKKL